MWKFILACLGEQVSNEGKSNPSMLRHWLGLPLDNEVLMEHQALYKQLLCIEWAIEKRRLARVAAFSMLLFCSFFCLMFSIGILVVVEFWATEYRSLSILLLVTAYALLLIISGIYLRGSLAEGKNTFAALGEEIATDLDLAKRVIL